jgi:hypothetical protein
MILFDILLLFYQYLPIAGYLSIVNVNPSKQDVFTVDEEDKHAQETGNTEKQTEFDYSSHSQIKPLDQVPSEESAPSTSRYRCVTYTWHDVILESSHKL